LEPTLRQLALLAVIQLLLVQLRQEGSQEMLATVETLVMVALAVLLVRVMVRVAVEEVAAL